MLPVHITEKLELFKPEKYRLLQQGEHTELAEKSESGKVKLDCAVQKETIILISPEDNVLPYLDEAKRGAKSCADIFLYSFDEEKNKWDLHILEFKKTINTTSISKSKWQFRMGLYNARAVAAFLGISIRNVYLYSGFRKDDIVNIRDSSLIAMRANNNREGLQKIRQWKSGICELSIDGIEKKFPHRKIQLDPQGSGNIEI